MKINLLAKRKRALTVRGPVTGDLYHVTPGQPVEVDDADGQALIEAESELWEHTPETKSARSRHVTDSDSAQVLEKVEGDGS